MRTPNRRIIMAVAAALWSFSLAAAEDFLLTDNNKPGWVSNTFPAAEKRLATGAGLSWVTDGDYASDKNLVTTGSRPEGKNRVLLDGRRGPEGDCQAYGSWGGGVKWGSFVIDLKGQYLITRAAVWTLIDPQRNIESFEVLLSNDGKKYVSMGSAAPDKELKVEQPKYGVKIELTLQKPALAQYVLFRVKKKPAAMQMVISEVAVWGTRPPTGDVVALLPENRRPTVTFNMTGIQSGALALDWSAFAQTADQVKQWKIYEAAQPFTKVTDPGIKLRQTVPGKTSRLVIYPLVPGQSYYFAVAAEYADGVYPVVKAIAYTPPAPFACATFGDMLAINHFWGGGGARVKGRLHGKEWEQAALDLLGTTPFRETRWWRAYPDIVAKFYEHNIGVLPFPSEDNYKNGLKMGIYAYSAGNEPELSGKPAAIYVENLKKNYALGKKLNPHVAVSAPTCNINNHSLEWLEGFYKLGAKDYFDVLDLHTYFGAVTDFQPPPGYPKGSPEALFERMEKVRAIMKKYGDENKPVISTEFGYTDCNVGNPVGHVTPESKAQFLVRGLILHYVLGFKRVYVYSFWDEGNDPNYTEHAFGLVDYELQKKPAFTAVVVLGRELGDTVLEGKLEGIKPPHFGYVFRNKKKNSFVTVVWDGSGKFSGTFKTAPGKVQLVEMTGKTNLIHTTPDGRFRAVFGPSPLYINSAAPPLLEKSVPVADTPTTGQITVTMPQQVFTIMPGRNETEITCRLDNRTSDRFDVAVNLEDSRGKIISAQTVKINAGTVATVPFKLAASSLALDRYRISLGYEDRYASHSAAAAFYVRKLQPDNGKINTGKIMMYGYDRPVWFISSDKLEVTVDPERGGRILEMIDKTTGANQLCLDYDRLGSLASVVYRYSIWDQVKSERGFGIGRNDRYELKPIPDGVVMTAGKTDGLLFAKELTLTGKAELVLKVKAVNRAAKELPFGYYLHPEYTVGGTGDNTTDVLLFPIGGQTISLPFWNGLGDRKIDQLTSGWWAVRDLNAKIELKQEFSPEKFRQPRLWFGIGCYNIEMESREGLKLAPGASWEGQLNWQLFHQITAKQ